ncbi:helix-turn-helix domain-containing protein [Streptomyces sp. CB01881]|uniref:helix-turn-helix domain-containing protein n=1 Tax=Streptomyces sp. CB01881 TaxID=2078691 RepID=UPI001386E19D|nr:helix-turn-helix domain-containing protein [Streptomyces sp. CB01881]
MTVERSGGPRVLVDDECEMAYGAPRSRLREHVLGYRGYRLASDRARRRLEVPTDVVTLTIGFEGSLRLTDAVATADTASFGSVVAGMRRTATIAEHSGRLHGLTVSLTPQGAYRILGPALGDLDGRWTEATAVFPGRSGREFTERLHDAPSWRARFALLDAHFDARFAADRAWDPSAAWAWEQLRASHGRTSVRALVDGTGWSRRRLEQRFREHLGLAPKQAADILRLQHALLSFERRPGWGGARIATHCGFYDQAHLTRSFRAVVGCSPSRFFASRRAAQVPEPTDRLAGRVTTAIEAVERAPSD